MRKPNIHDVSSNTREALAFPPLLRQSRITPSHEKPAHVPTTINCLAPHHLEYTLNGKLGAVLFVELRTRITICVSLRYCKNENKRSLSFVRCLISGNSSSRLLTSHLCEHGKIDNNISVFLT
jgi:hypothetical protein